MRQKQLGFTLVEIAIVLVIIGLLLGGVLKGQELINQAKIKNVINDINGVTAAVQAYQDRYRALPGDDPGAAGRWTATVLSATAGDGVITGLYNVSAEQRRRRHDRRADRRHGVHQQHHLPLQPAR